MENKKVYEVLMTVLANESQVVKEIFALHEQKYKYKQIAEKLNLNVNTVASHLKRVRDKVLKNF
jgi:DNA-binding CsgD family transcriptional regulator